MSAKDLLTLIGFDLSLVDDPSFIIGVQITLEGDRLSVDLILRNNEDNQTFMRYIENTPGEWVNRPKL